MTGYSILSGIVAEILVDREVLLLLEQLHRGFVPFVLPLQEAIENLLGEIDISVANLVVESFALFLEFLDVRLQEVVFARVEILDEIVAPFDGDLIVDGGTSHMPTLEQIDNDLGGLLVLGLGTGAWAPTITAIRAKTAISTSGRNASLGIGFSS